MKYYRVIKDTFMWDTGAILRQDNEGYRPVEDIWNRVPIKTEYISSHIIEHIGNSEFFERIYPDTLKGNLYRTKDQMLTIYAGAFKE